MNDNTTINDNIERFNDKYLKCIVSKYPSVTDYLKSTGAMIILQPPSDIKDVEITINDNGQTKQVSYQRNYIYLGDEFLASGYGLLTKEYRDKTESIADKWDDTINNLNDIDKYIATKSNNVDNKLLSLINDRVKINGGPIENTVVRLDGFDENGNSKKLAVYTKDIILRGSPAKYDDFGVLNTEIAIYDAKGFKHEVKDGVCVLPIGTSIKTIEVTIYAEDNDSGGLSAMSVLHKFDDATDNEGFVISYDTYQNEPYNQYTIDNVSTVANEFNSYSNKNDIMELQAKLDELNSSNYHYYVYRRDFQKYANGNYQKILDKTYDNAIKDIFLSVAATPETSYKYYPKLAELDLPDNQEELLNLVTDDNGNYLYNDKFDDDDLINLSLIDLETRNSLLNNEEETIEEETETDPCNNTLDFIEIDTNNSLSNNSSDDTNTELSNEQQTNIGEKPKILIASVENAISNHIVILPAKVCIKPQHYIMWNYNKIEENNNLSAVLIHIKDFAFFTNHNAPLNLPEDSYETNININLTNEERKYTTNGKFYMEIAIPSKFKLRKFILRKNMNEQFNLTGMVYKIRKEILMPCPQSTISIEGIFNCIKYDVYNISIDYPVDSTSTIFLNVVYDSINNSDTSEDILSNEIGNNLANDYQNINNIVHFRINDEEFNTTYWINGCRWVNNDFMNNTIGLANMLDEVKYNGLKP